MYTMSMFFIFYYFFLQVINSVVQKSSDTHINNNLLPATTPPPTYHISIYNSTYLRPQYCILGKFAGMFLSRIHCHFDMTHRITVHRNRKSPHCNH